MRLFRSNIFLWCLGIALAIQVFIAFETPIAGSFGDAAILSMQGVQDITPVKATMVSVDSGWGSFKDLYDEPGRVQLGTSPYGAEIKKGDVVVITVRYNTQTKA